MIKGSYRFRVFDRGRCISDTGEVDNLITSEARNYGDPFSGGYLCIGTGTVAPSITDIALGSEAAQVSGTFSTSGVIVMDGVDRYSRRSITCQFTGVTGNISEVGFKKSSNGSLLSRTLVRDGNGLLTIIPLQAHQVLEVTYSIYVSIPDVLLSGIITTQFGQEITYTIKPADNISAPAGVMAGRFDNPFAGSAIMALSLTGDTESTSVGVDYDQPGAECIVTAYWEATASERAITGFKAKTNGDNLPEITLSEPLSVPVDHDITMVFTFPRGD